MSTEPAKPLTAEELERVALDNDEQVANLLATIAYWEFRCKECERVSQEQLEERDREIAALQMQLAELIMKLPEDVIDAELKQAGIDSDAGFERLKSKIAEVSLSRAEKALKAARDEAFVSLVCIDGEWRFSQSDNAEQLQWDPDMSCFLFFKSAHTLTTVEFALSEGATFPELGNWDK